MNQRSAQLLAAALAALLIVLVGATVFVLLSRPAGPTPPPSPTGVALGSPSPAPTAGESPTFGTPSPSPLTSPSPESTQTESPSPSPTDAPTPSPSAMPTPTPTPTPPPTVNPTSPQREFRLLGLGLDSREAEASIERIVTFQVDGQSLISAQISNASAGGIRMCLSREAQDDQRECVRGRNVTLQRPVTDAGPSTWHVSIVGTRVLVSPHVTVTVRFNADEPRVTLRNLRYVGTAFTEYNGFEARITSRAAGEMRIEGSFEGGEAPYQLIVGRVGSDPIYHQTVPAVNSFGIGVQLEGETEYVVSLRNPEEFSEDSPPLVLVNLTWP